MSALRGQGNRGMDRRGDADVSDCLTLCMRGASWFDIGITGVIGRQAGLATYFIVYMARRNSASMRYQFTFNTMTSMRQQCYDIGQGALSPGRRRLEEKESLIKI